MTTRTVSRGPAGLALLGLALAAGCGPNPTTAPSSAPLVAPQPGRPAVPSAPTADLAAQATAAARDFLAAAGQDKPDPAKLTPAFKRLVGPPVTDADRPRGYSDWAAEQWLKGKLAGPAAAGLTAVELASGVFAVETAPPAGGRKAVLRMALGEGGWLVDWVHVSPAGQKPAALPPGDAGAAAFAALAFIEAVLADDRPLAEALLAPAAKARLAPPVGDADKAAGFSAGFLTIKLSNFRGSATGYEVEARDASSVRGQLTGPARRPFAVKVVKGTRPAEWLVDDFDPK